MPEEVREEANFKVVDRRPFTVEGTRRADAPVREEKREAESEKSRAATPRASASKPGDDRVDEGFAMLVELLANGALTHLGLTEDGVAGPLGINLPGARAMIDLIGVLQDKTTGNLTPAEEKFVGGVLFELHTRFVEMQKQAAAKRR